MLVWDYKRSHRLEREGAQRGLAGIYAIFRDIAQTDNVLGIMTSFISFIAKQREKPDAIVLETFDKEIILQDKVSIQEYDDLDAQLFRLIREAVEDGEICKDISVEDLHRVLSGLFYGVPLITHAMAGSDLFGDYQNALNYVFAGIVVKRSDDKIGRAHV